MPKLSLELWSALTAALVALYFYLKMRLTKRELESTITDLQSTIFEAENQQLTMALKELAEKTRLAREAYEDAKKSIGDGSDFDGPVGGNA